MNHSDLSDHEIEKLKLYLMKSLYSELDDTEKKEMEKLIANSKLIQDNPHNG